MAKVKIVIAFHIQITLVMAYKKVNADLLLHQLVKFVTITEHILFFKLFAIWQILE